MLAKRLHFLLISTPKPAALALLGAALAAMSPGSAAAQGISQTSHPITALPFSLLSSGFTSGGGLGNPKNGDKNIISSFGVSSVAKMTGGTFSMGTGIVGGIVPSKANLDKAHAFPVPFIPSRGHTAITFSQVTANATIKILTLTGELVQEIVKRTTGSDRIAWSPVENKQGQPLASGVYLFVIESSEGQIKTGKIMVIR